MEGEQYKEALRQVRKLSGASLLDCKKALQCTQNNPEAALKYLQEHGLAKGFSIIQQERVVREGLISAYVHHTGRIGVLVEVNCETDFVARCEEFRQLCKDLALQVAAMSPKYINEESIPEEELAKQRELLRAQAKGKDEGVLKRIIEGRIREYIKQVCLLAQPFIKDEKLTVSDYIASIAAKVKEKITIRRFVRFELSADS